MGRYFEVWVTTKKGSALFSKHDSLEEAWFAIANELDKIWLITPQFTIKKPDGAWYKGPMPGKN